MIPAYEYPEGVLRILNTIPFKNLSSEEDLEVLISDDSESLSVSFAIKNFIEDNPLSAKFITYIKRNNLIDKNPINNWNSLIQNAKGNYFILLHHDEYFSDNLFVEKLLFHIRRSNCSLFVLNLNVINQRVFYLSFISNRFRILLFFYLPGYLYLRNYLGPTAVMCIKRKHSSVRFDNKLKWLVDVDYYIRILKRCDNDFEYLDLCINSIVRTSGSITDTIKKDITSIKKQELAYLRSTDLKNQIWILIALSENIFLKLISYLESLFWVLLRISSTLVQKYRNSCL